MFRIVKNNSWNCLIIISVFVLTSIWIFSGQPRILENPSIPPKIEIIKANPDTETLRPQTNGGTQEQTTNPAYAHDASGSSTQSDTTYITNNGIGLLTLYNLPSAGYSYGTATLNLLYEAQGNSGGGDTYEIQYSLDNTGGACDSSTWTDLVSANGNAAGDHTLVTVSIPAAQDLTKICVRLNTDKDGGPDNAHVYIEDVYTEGEYNPVVYSVSVSDGNVSYGILGLNSTTSSITVGETQTVTNNGTGAEKINIMSSDAAGTTTWQLAASAASEAFEHYYSSTTGAGWDSFDVTNDYTTFHNSLAQNATTTLDLLINTPTVTNDNEAHSITITLQAVAP